MGVRAKGHRGPNSLVYLPERRVLDYDHEFTGHATTRGELHERHHGIFDGPLGRVGHGIDACFLVAAVVATRDRVVRFVCVKCCGRLASRDQSGES